MIAAWGQQYNINEISNIILYTTLELIAMCCFISNFMFLSFGQRLPSLVHRCNLLEEQHLSHARFRERGSPSLLSSKSISRAWIEQCL